MNLGGRWRAVPAGFTLLALLLVLRVLPVPAAEASREQVIDSYRQALRIDPDNLPLHFLLGAALLSSGDDRGALEQFRLAYPAFIESAEMNYNLGLASFRLGDLDSAQLYYDRAAGLGALEQPDVYPLANAFYDLALAYLDKDDFGEARTLLSRVLSLAPERLEIHRLLGDCLARSGDVDGAFEEFSRYLQRYPADPGAREYVYTLHFKRGLKQLEDNDLEAARTSFAAALENSPGSPVALYYLGSIAYRQKDHPKAAGLLGPILAEAPAELRDSTRSMLFDCARTLLERRHPDQARKAAAWLVGDEGATAREFCLAGNIDLALKDYAGAALAYRQALILDPACLDAAAKLEAADRGAVEAYVARGRQQLAAKDYRKALDQFAKALAFNAKAPAAKKLADRAKAALAEQAAGQFAAARSLLEQGMPRQALKKVCLGLTLAPQSAAGGELRRRTLGQLQQTIDDELAEAGKLAAAGDPAAAAAAFRRVLELVPDEPRASSGLAELASQSRAPALAAIARGDRALEEGHLDDARQAFGEAATLAPDLPEVKAAEKRLATMVDALVVEELLWGRRAYSAGRLQEAREHLANAIALRDSPRSRRELADVEAVEEKLAANLLAAARKATAASDFRQARRLYSRILELVPDHPQGREEREQLKAQTAGFVTTELNAVRSALKDGNLDQALAASRRVLEVDPANSMALASLESCRKQLADPLAELVKNGNRALGDGRFADAVEIFRQTLIIDPYQADARAALERISRLRLSGGNPGDEQQIYLQGIECYADGRYKDAVASWQKVLALDPGHEKARLNIEKAQRKLQQRREIQGG